MQQSPENTSTPLPPKNWLLENILITVFCCLPFGVVGIVQASRVEKLFYAGDHIGAAAAAKSAKQFCMIGFFTGLLLGIVSIIFFVLGIGYSL